MAAIIEDGKLRLSGYVGDYLFEDGFTSSDVIVALAQIDDTAPLAVHINSGGGVASEGAAIHALLTSRAGQTDVVVEGIAASAASLIAMAGDTVTMSAGAVMMIHDPAGVTFGTSSDHSKTIEGLEALATSYSRVYAAKSGKTADECRTIMRAERWFTPQQAVDEGFADATTETASEPVAAFDYRIYAHAPRALRATAKAKNWQLPAADARADEPSTRQIEEKSMTDKNAADEKAAEIAAARKEAVSAYQARRKAVMALPEAQGREALAENLVETELSEDAIKGALASAPKVEATPPVEDTRDDTAEFEARRLNAEGLKGKPAEAAAKGAELTNRILANYRAVTGAPAKKTA